MQCAPFPWLYFDLMLELILFFYQYLPSFDKLERLALVIGLILRDCLIVVFEHRALIKVDAHADHEYQLTVHQFHVTGLKWR